MMIRFETHDNKSILIERNNIKAVTPFTNADKTGSRIWTDIPEAGYGNVPATAGARFVVKGDVDEIHNALNKYDERMLSER